MAGFRTHITTSTVLGIGYGGAGILFGAPIESCLIAGGMCGVAGMLPDIDSDNGIPLRETTAFLAAVTPIFLLERFQQFQLSHESIILASGSFYLIIRFGLAAFIKKYTVHRGMFHSLPAAMIFAGLAFLICGCNDLHMRYYKSAAVLLGFLSHLVLDELYSIEWYRGRIRLKKSFGTALKFWGKSLWGNFSTYAKLLVVMGMIFSEPIVIDRLELPDHDDVQHTATQWLDNVWRR